MTSISTSFGSVLLRRRDDHPGWNRHHDDKRDDPEHAFAHQHTLADCRAEIVTTSLTLCWVTTPKRAATGGLLAWAQRRRFPTLLLITGGLFVVDLLVPDLIPFVDEILLGLGTLILSRLKDRRPTQ